MAELDRLYYSLGLDTSGLEKGINKAIKDFSQLSTQISQKVKKLNDSLNLEITTGHSTTQLKEMAEAFERLLQLIKTNKKHINLYKQTLQELVEIYKKIGRQKLFAGLQQEVTEAKKKIDEFSKELQKINKITAANQSQKKSTAAVTTSEDLNKQFESYKKISEILKDLISKEQQRLKVFEEQDVDIEQYLESMNFILNKQKEIVNEAQRLNKVALKTGDPDAISRTNAELSKQQLVLKELQTEYASFYTDGGKLLAGYQKKLDALRKTAFDVNNTNNKSIDVLYTYQSVLQEIIKELKKYNSAVVKQNNQTGDYRNQIVTISSELSKYQKELLRVNDAIKQQNSSLKQATTQFNSIMGVITRVSMLFGVSFSLNKYIKDIYAFSSEFDHAVREILTLLENSVDSTGDFGTAIDDLKQKILDLGQKAPFAYKDITKAMYQAISAGIEQNEIFEFMNNATIAAVGGVTDLQTAVDGLTTVMNSWNVSTKNMGDILDTFFTGVKEGKTTFSELSAQIGKVAPLATQLGISFDETVAALAALTKVGYTTAKATTALSRLFSDLIKPQEKAVKLAAELGIKFDAATVASEGLINFINELRQALDEYAKKGGDASEATLNLFGRIESQKAALALVGNAYEELVEINAEMANKTGSAQLAYDKMRNSVQLLNQAIKNNVDRLKENIYEGLLPIIKGILEFTQAFTGALSVLKGAPRTILLTSSAINAMSVAIGVLSFAISSLKKYLVPTLGTVGKFITGLNGIALVVSGVIAAISTANYWIKKHDDTLQASYDSLTQLNDELDTMAQRFDSIMGSVKMDKISEELERLKQAVIDYNYELETGVKANYNAKGVIDEILQQYPELEGYVKNVNLKIEDQNKLLLNTIDFESQKLKILQAQMEIELEKLKAYKETAEYKKLESQFDEQSLKKMKEKLDQMKLELQQYDENQKAYIEAEKAKFIEEKGSKLKNFEKQLSRSGTTLDEYIANTVKGRIEALKVAYEELNAEYLKQLDIELKILDIQKQEKVYTTGIKTIKEKLTTLDEERNRLAGELEKITGEVADNNKENNDDMNKALSTQQKLLNQLKDEISKAKQKMDDFVKSQKEQGKSLLEIYNMKEFQAFYDNYIALVKQKMGVIETVITDSIEKLAGKRELAQGQTIEDVRNNLENYRKQLLESEAEIAKIEIIPNLKEDFENIQKVLNKADYYIANKAEATTSTVSELYQNIGKAYDDMIDKIIQNRQLWDEQVLKDTIQSLNEQKNKALEQFETQFQSLLDATSKKNALKDTIDQLLQVGDNSEYTKMKISELVDTYRVLLQQNKENKQTYNALVAEMSQYSKILLNITDQQELLSEIESKEQAIEILQKKKEELEKVKGAQKDLLIIDEQLKKNQQELADLYQQRADFLFLKDLEDGALEATKATDKLIDSWGKLYEKSRQLQEASKDNGQTDNLEQQINETKKLLEAASKFGLTDSVEKYANELINLYNQKLEKQLRLVSLNPKDEEAAKQIKQLYQNIIDVQKQYFTTQSKIVQLGNQLNWAEKNHDLQAQSDIIGAIIAELKNEKELLEAKNVLTEKEKKRLDLLNVSLSQWAEKQQAINNEIKKIKDLEQFNSEIEKQKNIIKEFGAESEEGKKALEELIKLLTEKKQMIILGDLEGDLTKVTDDLNAFKSTYDEIYGTEAQFIQNLQNTMMQYHNLISNSTNQTFSEQEQNVQSYLNFLKQSINDILKLGDVEKLSKPLQEIYSSLVKELQDYSNALKKIKDNEFTANLTALEKEQELYENLAKVLPDYADKLKQSYQDTINLITAKIEEIVKKHGDLDTALKEEGNVLSFLIDKVELYNKLLTDPKNEQSIDDLKKKYKELSEMGDLKGQKYTIDQILNYWEQKRKTAYENLTGKELKTAITRIDAETKYWENKLAIVQKQQEKVASQPLKIQYQNQSSILQQSDELLKAGKLYSALDIVNAEIQKTQNEIATLTRDSTKINAQALRYTSEYLDELNNKKKEIDNLISNIKTQEEEAVVNVQIALDKKDVKLAEVALKHLTDTFQKEIDTLDLSKMSDMMRYVNIQDTISRWKELVEEMKNGGKEIADNMIDKATIMKDLDYLAEAYKQKIKELKDEKQKLIDEGKLDEAKGVQTQIDTFELNLKDVDISKLKLQMQNAAQISLSMQKQYMQQLINEYEKTALEAFTAGEKVRAQENLNEAKKYREDLKKLDEQEFNEKIAKLQEYAKEVENTENKLIVLEQVRTELTTRITSALLDQNTEKAEEYRKKLEEINKEIKEANKKLDEAKEKQQLINVYADGLKSIFAEIAGTEGQALIGIFDVFVDKLKDANFQLNQLSVEGLFNDVDFQTAAITAGVQTLIDVVNQLIVTWQRYHDIANKTQDDLKEYTSTGEIVQNYKDYAKNKEKALALQTQTTVVRTGGALAGAAAGFAAGGFLGAAIGLAAGWWVAKKATQDAEKEIEELNKKLDATKQKLAEAFNVDIDSLASKLEEAINSASDFSDFQKKWEEVIEQTTRQALIKGFMVKYLEPYIQDLVDAYVKAIDPTNKEGQGEIITEEEWANILSKSDAIGEKAKALYELLKKLNLLPNPGEVSTQADAIRTSISEETGNRLAGLMSSMNEHLFGIKQLISSVIKNGAMQVNVISYGGFMITEADYKNLHGII